MDTTTDTETRAPLFVFLGIVGLSLIFFFVFTKGMFSSEQTEPVESPDQPAGGTDLATFEGPGPEFADADPGGVAPLDPGTDGDPGPDGERSPGGRPERSLLPEELKAPYAKAPRALREFAQHASDATLEEHLGGFSLPPAEVKLLGALFHSGAWSIPSDRSPLVLGQFGEKVRWRVPFNDGSSSQARGNLYVDLLRVKDGDGWQLADVRIPPEAVPAAVAAAGTQGARPEPGAIREEPDSLMAAETFMNAVAGKDYDKAIAMADLESITREKVAGLFIIFDEGHYRLKEEKSLMATVTTGEVAWIVGRIESAAGLAASDFGVELTRSHDRGWRVKGLHFSKLLASFAAATTSDTVPYTPIVENPSGGESLVLYFGYDEDGLHLRAQRQLTIVAALLKDDAEKGIRITGHADAHGSETYNDRLSYRRALAVREQLVKLGVNSAQIITEGFGESAPLAENIRPDGSDNPVGRSKNRRTEIFLDF